MAGVRSRASLATWRDVQDVLGFRLVQGQMDDIRAHRIEALPHDRLLEILSRYNRLPR